MAHTLLWRENIEQHVGNILVEIMNSDNRPAVSGDEFHQQRVLKDKRAISVFLNNGSGQTCVVVLERGLSTLGGKNSHRV